MEPLQTVGGAGTLLLLDADDCALAEVNHSSAPSGPLRIRRKPSPIVIHATLPFLLPDGELSELEYPSLYSGAVMNVRRGWGTRRGQKPSPLVPLTASAKGMFEILAPKFTKIS